MYLSEGWILVKELNLASGVKSTTLRFFSLPSAMEMPPDPLLQIPIYQCFTRYSCTSTGMIHAWCTAGLLPPRALWHHEYEQYDVVTV